MTESLARTGDPELLRTLVTTEDEAELEDLLAEVDALTAARAVALSGTLEQKTALLWAMEDPQRRQVLEILPAPLIGALVQNVEDENRYLLGDVSLDQFRALLSLCSPERKYYWLITALSFTDARANILPLLLSTRELVDIFLTRSEFEDHLRALGDYPLEDARIAPDLFVDPAQTLVDLIGPENLLTEFPIKEPTLARVLQNLLDFDQDRYVDLIREGLRAIDYQENHPLEWETLTEDPILVDALAPAPEVEAAAPSPGEEEEPAPEEPQMALALVPTDRSPLVRLAAALPTLQQQRVADELQYLFLRQAVAEGGSFLLDDLTRVARSVEAYLQLGLRAESGGTREHESQVLLSRSLHKIHLTGARQVERLRQVALRVRPLEKVLDDEQRSVVASLAKPRLTLTAEGEPRLRLLPGGKLPETVDLTTAEALIHDVGAWTALARGLGLAHTQAALLDAGSTAELLEALALGAAVYGRLELGLADAADRRRFRARYVPTGTDTVAPEAFTGLRAAVLAWADGRVADPELILPLLERALTRVAQGDE